VGFFAEFLGGFTPKKPGGGYLPRFLNPGRL